MIEQKLAFLAYGVRTGVLSETLMETEEQEGLALLLDELSLELQENRVKGGI